MRTFLKNRTVEWWGAACLAFLAVAWLPQRRGISTCLSGLLFSAFAGLTITYWKTAWVATRDPQSTLGGRIMVVCLAGVGTGICGVFGWSLAFQYFGQLEWMRFHPVSSFFKWMIFVSAVGLSGVAVVDGNAIVPTRNFSKLGAIVALTMSLVILLAYLSGGFADAG